MKHLATLLTFWFLVFGGFARSFISDNQESQHNPDFGNSTISQQRYLLIEEDFADIETLIEKGWVIKNMSQPAGTTSWFQGDPQVFPANEGDPNSYLAADASNISGAGTISNWLISPEIEFDNRDTLYFITRTRSQSNPKQDRMQVRLSINGGSTDVGASASSVGDFTSLIMDINFNFDNNFPGAWVEYIVIIMGVHRGQSGRIAFRYFLEDGGPDGLHSDYIGLDNVIYATKEPPVPLYSQNQLITQPGDGPFSTSYSAVQTSLGLSSFGSSFNYNDGNSIADDFIVPPGHIWHINNFRFFGYQGGSTTTSTFTNAYIRVYKGDPQEGGQIVANLWSTNNLTHTGWTRIYRVYDDDLNNTSRPVMYLSCNVNKISLQPGHYWVEVAALGTLPSGPWVPPVTVNGEISTGDAYQKTPSGWDLFVDGGTLTGMGMPFEVYGEDEALRFVVIFWVFNTENGYNGTISAYVDDQEIEYQQEIMSGKTVDLLATPDEGYKVKYWYVNGEYIMDSDELYTGLTFSYQVAGEEVFVGVEFESVSEILFYEVWFEVIEAEGSANGNLTASINDVNIEAGDLVEEGSNIVFSAIPNDHYNILEWRINNEVVIYESNPLKESELIYSNLDSDIDISVEFVLETSSNDITTDNPSILYPNPFHEIINISNSDKINRITFTNLLGQSVLIYETDSRNYIKTDFLPSGLYLVTIEFIDGLQIIERITKN